MVFEQMRKRMRIFVYLIVIAMVIGGLYLGFGYYFGGGSNNNVSTGAAGQNVLASVNGEEISYRDFYNVLQNYQNNMMSLPEYEIIPFQARILDSLVNRSLLLQEAKKQKIEVEVTQTEIDDTLQGVLQQNQMTMEQLEENLAGYDLTIDDIKKDIQESLKESKLIQGLIDKVRNDVEVTPEEIAAEYEKVHLYDIFIMFDNHESKDKALARAQKAQEELAQGQEFTEVAKMYSESTSKERGGDLGFISRKDYIDEKILKKAFELETGKVSDLIETDEGYHLVQITEKIEAKGEKFEEQKEQIVEELKKQKGTTHYYQWFDELKASADIEIFNSVFSGYFNLEKENFGQAVEDFKKAVEESPEAGVLRSFLAQAYYEKGQVEEAISTYEQALKDFPEDYQLRFAFGELYRRMGEVEKAVENYEKAGELAKDDFLVNLQLMRVFQNLDMDEKAQVYKKRMDEIQKKYEEQQKKLQEEAASSNQQDQETATDDETEGEKNE